jgi:CheY-like chemotaxis protein
MHMTQVKTPPADDTKAASPAEHAGLRRQRVLYIEDNPVNAITVQDLVQNHTRLDIVIEENGSNGVERALQMLPDLILIDMQLPDFDGLEVLRRLKASPLTASLTCIALSANAQAQYIADALAAGFDDYWTKPIEFDEFLRSLERVFPDAVHHTPLQ